MCGIAGFTSKTFRADDDRIRRAVSCLIHRGPDQQGTFRSDALSLGAVRLRVIDIEGGDQPITSEDGDTTIVFNGEIYNYPELRDELVSLGHRFRTHCDTEVLLEAFREWDTECFNRLRGMFAVALWSESRKRLVLARDRMGIKPLYYYRLGDDLLFGSELKGDPGSSGSPAAVELDGTRILFVFELCAVSAHFGGRRRTSCRLGIGWSGSTAAWIPVLTGSFIWTRNAIGLWNRRRKRWKATCGGRSRNISFRMFRLEFGPAAVSIPRRCCTTPRSNPPRV